MNWEVVARPQVVADILEAAEWYNTQRVGLGDEFTEEILTVFDALAINPLLHCLRHPTRKSVGAIQEDFPIALFTK